MANITFNSISSPDAEYSIISYTFLERLFNGLLNEPTNIQVTFWNKGRIPHIKIVLVYKHRIKENLISPTNEAFNCAIIEMLYGDTDFIVNYQTEEHPIIETEENTKMKWFSTFLKGNDDSSIEKDYTTEDGKTYLFIRFILNRRNEVYFFIERNEQVNSMINQYCKPKK